MDSIKADHGFNLDSPSVRNLLQVMSEYNESEQRAFLQFVTGSPKLPIGGEYPNSHCSRVRVDVSRLQIPHAKIYGRM